MAQDTMKTTRPTTGRCMVCHKDKPGLLPCDERGRPTCEDCGTPITNDPDHRWCVDCEERLAINDGWMRILVSGVGDGGRVLHGIVIVQAADYDPRLAQYGDYWRASLRTPSACPHWYPRSRFTPEQAAACLVQDYPLRLCPVLGAGRIT